LGQEFVIKSTTLEDKINQLLPSQGGAQAGVDLSASSMIVPIVDLTESAEGSNLRADLQTSIDFANEPFDVSATTTTLVNTTGFFRVFGTATMRGGDDTLRKGAFILSDGVTDKRVWAMNIKGGTTESIMVATYDFIVYLRAGDSLKCISPNNEMLFGGSTRQIADISGNLTNPFGFS
jgi:hypothetical protein